MPLAVAPPPPPVPAALYAAAMDRVGDLEAFLLHVRDELADVVAQIEETL